MSQQLGHLTLGRRAVVARKWCSLHLPTAKGNGEGLAWVTPQGHRNRTEEAQFLSPLHSRLPQVSKERGRGVSFLSCLSPKDGWTLAESSQETLIWP